MIRAFKHCFFNNPIDKSAGMLKMIKQNYDNNTQNIQKKRKY